jgi:hypothetical protein
VRLRRIQILYRPPFPKIPYLAALPIVVTLYVLKGKTGKRYVGITNNLPRRIQAHSLKLSKGAQVLGDFSVLHTEEFPDLVKEGSGSMD